MADNVKVSQNIAQAEYQETCKIKTSQALAQAEYQETGKVKTFQIYCQTEWQTPGKVKAVQVFVQVEYTIGPRIGDESCPQTIFDFISKPRQNEMITET
jgi:hypothetical protein